MSDWTLNPEQMFFMLEHHNLIATAYAKEDMNSLRQLANTENTSLFLGQ